MKMYRVRVDPIDIELVRAAFLSTEVICVYMDTEADGHTMFEAILVTDQTENEILALKYVKYITTSKKAHKIWIVYTFNPTGSRYDLEGPYAKEFTSFTEIETWKSKNIKHGIELIDLTISIIE